MPYRVDMLQVRILRECFESMLELARTAHPRETFLLLRGFIRNNVATVSEVLLPPPSYVGFSSIGVDIYRLPMDFSIIGIAHSHPSGSLNPSVQDLNSKYKYFFLIVAYPYRSEMDVAAYDFNCRRLEIAVIS
ncbi:MAG: Mov34/MPN/PAD-1 family protein [archaeon GB-1867-097]|nr:Mov34/MPN/PAD-1 family protein [Candidatus Culexmicrobium thermophilum]RLE56188.1 MAG: metalloprotease [Candidatus Verstraetearchaeota archaeon]